MFAKRRATVKYMPQSTEISFDWLDGDCKTWSGTSTTLLRSGDKNCAGGLFRWMTPIERKQKTTSEVYAYFPVPCPLPVG
jgi:hypothetical protein